MDVRLIALQTRGFRGEWRKHDHYSRPPVPLATLPPRAGLARRLDRRSWELASLWCLLPSPAQAGPRPHLLPMPRARDGDASPSTARGLRLPLLTGATNPEKPVLSSPHFSGEESGGHQLLAWCPAISTWDGCHHVHISAQETGHLVFITLVPVAQVRRRGWSRAVSIQGHLRRD